MFACDRLASGGPKTVLAKTTDHKPTVSMTTSSDNTGGGSVACWPMRTSSTVVRCGRLGSWGVGAVVAVAPRRDANQTQLG